MKVRAQAVFTLFFACAGLWVVLQSRDWPFATRLFPWLLGIPIVVLSVIQFILDLKEPPVKGRITVDSDISEAIGKEEGRKKAINILLWITGYAICIWLLGFKLALLLMLFGYLKFQGRESWKLSAGLTAAGYLLFWVVFDHLLHLILPESQVWLWIERLGEEFVRR